MKHRWGGSPRKTLEARATARPGSWERIRRSARAEMRILVYADDSGNAGHLAAGLSRLGARTVVVRTPLDAIVKLQDEADPVHAAFVPVDSAGFNMAAFCAFLKDAHPSVRRMAFTEGNRRRNGVALDCSRHCERVLRPAGGVGALADALDALI